MYLTRPLAGRLWARPLRQLGQAHTYTTRHQVYEQPRHINPKHFWDRELLDSSFKGSSKFSNSPEEEEGEGGSHGQFKNWEQIKDSSYRKDLLKSPAAVPIPGADSSPQEVRQYLESAKKSYRLGTVLIPKALSQKIADILKGCKDECINLLSGYPRKWLKQDAQDLSAVLRARTTEHVKPTYKLKSLNLDKPEVDPLITKTKELVSLTTPVQPLVYNQRQCMAYIAHRVPGIYGCNYRALSEIKQNFPQFQPTSMIDFGSGPGTATWAAMQLFPSIKSIKVIEPSIHMSEINEAMLEGFPVTHRREYLTQAHTEAKSDLVIASYSITELTDEASRNSTVRLLWENVARGGVLCLVESGTPIGFRIIRNARSLLLDLLGGNGKNSPKIIAPCTQEYQCPMGKTSGSWCHFVQRVQRISTQFVKRTRENAMLNYENEKYSYILVSKGDVKLTGATEEERAKVESEEERTEEWGRLIRQPIKRGRHIILDSCGSDGLLRRQICSKSLPKVLYRSARKSKWGDIYDTKTLYEALETKEGGPKRPWRALREEDKKRKKIRNQMRTEQAKASSEAEKQMMSKHVKDYAKQAEEENKKDPRLSWLKRVNK